MLQGADLEVVIVRYVQKHEDFILPVAMRMDQSLAVQHFDQSVEFKIARRRDSNFSLGGLSVVGLPSGLVSNRVVESFADDIFNTHSGRRIAAPCSRRCPAPATAASGLTGAFGILTERELDPGHGAFE